MVSEAALDLQAGRALVSDIAPDEAPFFTELITDESSGDLMRGDFELGFGGEDALVGALSLFIFHSGKLILPFMWEQAQAVIGEVTRTAINEFRAQFEDKVRAWIKARFRGPKPVSLSSEQVDALLARIREDAKGKGIEESEITRVNAALSRILIGA